MSLAEQDSLSIRANAGRNGLTTLVLGMVGLALSGLWLVFMPQWLLLGGIFLTSASIVAMLVGWFKLREPQFSLTIDHRGIAYHHRSGHWILPWDNFKRVGCPRVRKGLEHVDLEFIGFTINDYAQFVKDISPRLATHLLMEQRPLLMQGDDCPTGTCYGNDFLATTRFKLPSGEVLNGVQAMLASRMQQLREHLGYDVFLSATELDRTPAEFVNLVKQCHTSLALANTQEHHGT